MGIPLSSFLKWSEADQDAALAWQREQRLTCPGCGTRADEWKRDFDPYEAVAVRCRGCQLLEEARRDASDSGDSAGLKFELHREVAED